MIHQAMFISRQVQLDSSSFHFWFLKEKLQTMMIDLKMKKEKQFVRIGNEVNLDLLFFDGFCI
jgi:hypothetical protein